MALPKGGGAIRGIGEKFTANPSNGTASLAVPIATSPGRAGFDLQLALSYNSGAGNGPFGMGWNLSVPAVTRKTDQGLPRYIDREDSDVFVLSGAEDLVPELRDGPLETRDGFEIVRYLPRVEGLFARIERWSSATNGVHWRVTTRDNVVNVYGRTADARIADPDDDRRVFSWLLEETRDDRGNAVHYLYKREDAVGVERSKASEANRPPATAQRYLKRIRYGNRAPLGRGDSMPTDESGWLFEVVADYGEHDRDEPTPAERAPWPVREDPFSTYRAGFEVRSYRLCRRVLMFHRFAELERDPCLVRSTDFEYDASAADDAPLLTYLRAVKHVGYRWDATGNTYVKGELPPLEFEYTRPVVHDEPRAFDAASLEAIPAGVEGTGAQWVDLDAEGIPGVLQPTDRAWYYKANQGEGRLAPPVLLRSLPAPAELHGGAQLLSDLDGDGQLDLVRYSPPLAGYFERTEDGDWNPFVALPSIPNLDWNDPSLRFVDLDGDGHPDVLITEREVFVWYRSRAKGGFEAPVRVTRPHDELDGPAVLFSDGTETIHLADMSGDGLVDIVRVRIGEVCYWPNLGRGRFGRRVTLDGSPWFDTAELFDPKRVRFADVDGSGTSDLLYLGREGVAIFFNRSGNALSAKRVVTTLPASTSNSNLSVADVLGQGTACLVWSSTSPVSAGRPLAYVDLMGGTKPHLLVTFKNNLGAETRVRYAPSTRFYLADKAAGRPWITRLAFPVHVVERVETVDRVGRNRFYTRYAYHHGYFDGHEREFRGFGMVEQWDTEELGSLRDDGAFPPDHPDSLRYEPPAVGDNFDRASYVAPVLTRTWFHTGVFFDRLRIARRYEPEFYGYPSGATDAERVAFHNALPRDAAFPLSWSADEMREACRALKGSILRQEVYGKDGTPKADHPYTLSERSYEVVRLQARAGERPGVFFSHTRETVDTHLERDPSDPRVVHTLTLSVDRFGNVERQATVAYGRRVADDIPASGRSQQTDVLATLTETAFTTNTHVPPRDAIDTPEAWRTPLPCDVRTYELVGLRLLGNRARFTFEEVKEFSDRDDRPYHDPPAANTRRLIERERTRYRRDDLTAPLPFGQFDARATPYESYKLAFTPGLLSRLYDGRVTPAMLHDAGYVQLEGDAGWWVPSGRAYFAPAEAPELAYARDHFFLPRRFRDRFGDLGGYDSASVRYDAHDLLLVEARDAVGNSIKTEERNVDDVVVWSGNDYRVLQPAMVMDPNRNRQAVAFDALGMVVATAVMGKPEESHGDGLTGFATDFTPVEFAAYLAGLADLPANEGALLGEATTRLVYDLDAYGRTQRDATPQGASVHALVRETHASDLSGGAPTRVQHAFTYSDGFGREAQKKVQAESGPLVEGGLVVSSRWVGSGWTIFNNKGKPVRAYEPFFTATSAFEFARLEGVSPIAFYDTAGRAVATLHPDRTWEKVVFGPWGETRWDANDTVAVSDASSDPDVGHLFGRIQRAAYTPSWYDTRVGRARGTNAQAAAIKALAHRDTPTTVSLDTLGRPFLTVARNRYDNNGVTVEASYATRTVIDIEGNERAVFDAKGREVMRYDHDMLGQRARQSSMEAGERRTLADITRKPVRSWDSLGHAFEHEYDALRRPTRTWVTGADRRDRTARVLYEETTYGEDHPDDVALNLRTRVYEQRDAAGLLAHHGTDPATGLSEAYDFKGNPLRSVRTLAEDYKNTLDWSGPVSLETGATYATATRYDALNRPTELRTPDGSRTFPMYNEAGLLDAIEMSVRGGTREPYVRNIDYNAKGQRTRVEYGNHVTTTWAYDRETFRLRRLVTRRQGEAEALQELSYTYDPVGNITRIQDDAHETFYVRGSRVEPSANYTYDAIYRLIEATGREHRGLLDDGASTAGPTPTSFSDVPRVGRPHPNDSRAMGTYVERYLYDEVGNIQEMNHRRVDPAHSGWSREYRYESPSQLDPGQVSNRLTRTDDGSGLTRPYAHDDHGNMLSMPHLQRMEWNCRDQLVASVQDASVSVTPETTYYVYDAAGERVRKVTEAQGGARAKERVYVGRYEVFRDFTSGLVRETLHVVDDKRRVALVEARVGGAESLVRYQFDNHLGTACLELGGAQASDTEVISYEEYYPYGGTAHQGVRAGETVPKRYRYTGKERDEETGLYYHGARYYAPWLGRWTSADPAGMVDGTCLYQYAKNEPTNLVDSTGHQSGPYDSYVRLLRFEAEVSNLASAVWNSEVVQGDFHQGESSWGGTIANTVIGLVPVVGQVADVRDSAAALSSFVQNPSWGTAGGVGLAAVAWIPGGGDLAKGGVKLARRALREGGEELLERGGREVLQRTEREVASHAPAHPRSASVPPTVSSPTPAQPIQPSPPRTASHTPSPSQGGESGAARRVVVGHPANATPNTPLHRAGTRVESAHDLAKAADKARSQGFPHGVSVNTNPDALPSLAGNPGTSAASREAFENAGFPVHHTPTKPIWGPGGTLKGYENPGHHTVELPEPVTPDAARRFNDVLNRR